MNVYDEAHSLERAIKASEEYKQYRAAKEKVDGNPEIRKMLDDFQAKQFELQAKQLTGEEMGPEMMENIQRLYAIVAADPLAAEYLQCEMRFQLMMQDVFNILGEVMGMPPAE